ncbi:MAG TPA: amidohydrolase family protein, partial [Ilumatobacter sp.]|nr:amidohydrolase family protein [Ilumatobacter sp.]
FLQNCWMGVSQPGPADVAAGDVLGPDRFMWGSDYPHDEGTYPFTREHLRQAFAGVSSEQLAGLLAGNAAKLYDFDLDALLPLAAKLGPTVDELAQPLTELPENPNGALLKGVLGAPV